MPVSELREPTRSTLSHVILALTAFAIVGLAASGLIKSIIAISSHFGVPEYILSFFGAAIGTSLPELAVEFTALKRNQRQMALGDIFGSCLVDASLSIGIGPLLFPTTVSANLALKGSMLAIAALVVAGTLLSLRQKHDKFSGATLIIIYLFGYFILK